MRRYADKSPRFIVARFDSTCPQTQKKIRRGDTCAWYPSSRVAYHVESKAAADLRGMEFSAAYGMADANY